MTDLIGPFWDLYVTGLNGRVGQGQRLVQKAYPHIISRKKKKTIIIIFLIFYFCQGITESLSQRFKTTPMYPILKLSTVN